MKLPTKSALFFLLKPKAIILGSALFYYIVDRVSWERLMSSCQPLPCYQGDHTPVIGVPFKLLFAACALVLNRWWGDLIAMLISGSLLYGYGYLLMVGCANSHEQPVLSPGALDCWLQHVTSYYPRYLINFTFALIIFSYATIFIVRYVIQLWDLRRNGV